ncbi:MAG: metal-binding protein [Parachlamydiales bacterium]|nr:metal-binding protein [Parachlamydiales bacterium]
MPAYRTHVAVNLVLGLPIALAALKYSVPFTPQELFSFSAAFLYGTLFLHPDLDIAYKIKLFSLKGLLTLPFRPYSYLFRHRGISHMPIVGTLTRVLWLGFFFWLVFGWTLPPLWFALGGLATADLFHILLDKTSLYSK